VEPPSLLAILATVASVVFIPFQMLLVYQNKTDVAYPAALFATGLVVLVLGLAARARSRLALLPMALGIAGVVHSAAWFAIAVLGGIPPH
jgi:hypothetical protein